MQVYPALFSDTFGNVFSNRYVFAVLKKWLCQVGQKTKNAHKTETFLLFGKIVKKLIITGVSNINFIVTQ